MDLERLLDSYDQIDLEYRNRFCDIEERHPDIGDRDSGVPAGRKTKDAYVSFVPNAEETEKILLEPLRRMRT